MIRTILWFSILLLAVNIVITGCKPTTETEEESPAAYSSNDLTGTWFDVGISTPVINTNDSSNFGYDVDKAVLSKGTGTFTPISSSDSLDPDTGTLTINSDGVVSDGDPTNSFIFMNASKDVMIQLYKDDVTHHHAMFIYVKKNGA